MKKVITAAFVLLIISCSSKPTIEREARINRATLEPEYTVWVWDGNEIIGKFSFPLSEYSKHKEDSLVRLADSVYKLQNYINEFNKRN